MSSCVILYHISFLGDHDLISSNHYSVLKVGVFLGEIGLSMNSPSVDPIVDIKKRVATSRGSTTGDRHEKCYERRANRVLDEICSKNCPENAARRVQRAPRTMS